MQSQPRVLSLMAHPDDAEMFCAGTLIKLQDQGFEVFIASMTPGDCGSREHDADEISRIRRDEGRHAAARIKAHYLCLDFRDLQITYDPPTIKTVVECVREVRPEIVITHSPQDYMPDHEFTSLAVRNACFAASAPNFDSGRRPGAPPTERIPHLYYAAPAAGTDIFGQPIPSSLYIDISDVVGLKADMLAEHKSQREWLRAQHGMDEYIEEMRRWSAAQGEAIGVAYAEGFRQHLGHPYPPDDRVGELLKGVRKGG